MRHRRSLLGTFVTFAALFGVFFLVAVSGSHPQSTSAGTVRFTQVGGNEWWLQMRLEGPSASSVMAKDTDGAWISLQSQTWTIDGKWWAASFRIEPGHQVMFKAAVAGDPGVESCWFD